jgi:hypothetical protein
MNKPKFSQAKAKRAVEISSKIEGHKIPSPKTPNPKSVKTNEKK